MIMEYIDEEQMKKQWKRVDSIITEVKEAGGVNSNTFRDVRRQIKQKRTETVHVIEDKNGEIKETAKEIKEVYATYYKELLETKKGETEEEKKNRGDSEIDTREHGSTGKK